MKRVESNSSSILSDSINKWFAVKVKYKCEKLVCNRLLKQGIVAYVPLIKSTKQYSSKRKSIEKPIIHSFVFVQITKTEYIKVLETLHVFSFLMIGNELTCIPNYEMNLLKQVVGEFEDIVVEERNYFIGQRVEIIRGNLTGLQGFLVEEKNKNEFFIELPSLGLQMRIEINKAFLRPVLTQQLA